MKEAVFNTEVVNSLEFQGAWAYKIPDVVAGGYGMRFTPEKPCDILGGYQGTFFGIECKQMKKFQAFGLSALRSNQIDALDRMVRLGNPAFVFLNVRIKAEKGVAKQENRMIILDWASWGDKLREASIKKASVKQMEHVLGKSYDRSIRFDMTDFFKRLNQYAQARRT